MKNLKIIIFFFLGCFNLISQIQFEADEQYLDLIHNDEVKAYYANSEMDLESIRHVDFFQNISPSDLPKKGENLWIKFKLRNANPQSQKLFVHFDTPYITVYVEENDKYEAYQSGFLQPIKNMDYKETYSAVPMDFKPDEEKQVFLKIINSRIYERPLSLIVGNQLNYYQRMKNQEKYTETTGYFSVFYFSALLIVFIYIVMLYLLNRERVYLFYMIYVFFQMLYSLFSYPEHPLKFLNISYYYPEFALISSEPIQFIFVGFYILFILSLLQIDKKSLLGKVMLGLVAACFAYAIAMFFAYSFAHNPNLKTQAFRISRGIILPINLFLIIWIILKIKHPLIYYFIIAHLFFFFGAVSAVFVMMNGIPSDPNSILYFSKSADVIFQAGLLGEVICFSFALSLRVRLVQAEKQRSTKAYIEQLIENEEIQNRMNRELDRKVNEKTEELLQVYLKMERQREKEIKMEFTQKINEMETLALRSQMNPHFLFNSMNAIKHLIMIDRPEDAIYYLDDFSILLRTVLQNSKKHTITVDEELDVLKLYLSMEKIRLGDGFHFDLDFKNSEELNNFLIPGLILQPIVENAIWHGLIPSPKSKKKLWIKFEINETLEISILDNGIGREQSLKNKEGSFDFHKSMGLKIIRERLALFNHAHDTKIEMNIKDLEEDGKSFGTLVTFTYINSQPADNHD